MLGVLGQVVERGDVQAELARLAELAETDAEPDQVWPRYGRGELHDGLGDVEDAVAVEPKDVWIVRAVDEQLEIRAHEARQLREERLFVCELVQAAGKARHLRLGLGERAPAWSASWVVQRCTHILASGERDKTSRRGILRPRGARTRLSRDSLAPRSNSCGRSETASQARDVARSRWSASTSRPSCSPTLAQFRNTYDSDNTVFSPCVDGAQQRARLMRRRQGRLHQVRVQLSLGPLIVAGRVCARGGEAGCVGARSSPLTQSGSAAVGLRSNTHVILLALKRSTGELASYQKKLIRIDDHIGIAIAGLTSDARVLSNAMRQQAMNSRMLYARPIPINRVVNTIAERASKSFVEDAAHMRRGHRARSAVCLS